MVNPKVYQSKTVVNPTLSVLHPLLYCELHHHPQHFVTFPDFEWDNKRYVLCWVFEPIEDWVYIVPQNNNARIFCLKE